MKKIASLFLSFALMATMLVTTAFAAGPVVYGEQVGANAGEEVIVDVSISGNTGFGAATLKLNYDSSVLTLKGMTLGLLSGGVTNLNTGKVSFASATDVTGDGVLFSAIFVVAKNAPACVTPVSVSVEVMSNTSGEDLSPSVSQGSVSVTKAHVHSYTNAGTTEPNCTERGYTTYKCACGHSYRDNYVEALGHTYAETGTTEPTCTTPGSTRYACSVCGDSYHDNHVDATGHTYTTPVFNWADDYSSCTVSYKCTTCSEEFTETCDASVEITLATETTAGEIVYTVTFMLDGQTYTETKSVDLPQLVPAPGVEPSGNPCCVYAVLYVILGALIGAAIAFLLFFLWKKKKDKDEKKSSEKEEP